MNLNCSQTRDDGVPNPGCFSCGNSSEDWHFAGLHKVGADTVKVFLCPFCNEKFLREREVPSKWGVVKMAESQ